MPAFAGLHDATGDPPAWAERDIRAAYEWYESQQHGLGEQFLSTLREKIEFIRGFPATMTNLPDSGTRPAFPARLMSLDR